MSNEGTHPPMPPQPSLRSALAALAADRSPRFASSVSSQAAWTLGLVLALVLWLVALGRPLTCPCGTVSLWVSDVHSPQASQQFADWYSLLHVVFGFALWLFLDWMKPHWSTGQTFVLAIASSVAWEGIENLPVIIALFGNAPGAPAYAGDSVLNAVADTLFVALGFLLASRLPVALLLALALAAELLVLWMAGDGYLLGSLRLLGWSV